MTGPSTRGGLTTASAVLICSLAFVMLFGYAIARPATESLFLEVYGSKRLPAVWLAGAVTVTAVVAGYNAAAARTSLGRVMTGAVLVSAAMLVLIALLHRGGLRSAAFLLYIWKDVHIVVLLEALWSFANLVFPTGTARRTYGLFCAAGSLGGLSGNLSVGELAALWGTDATLWLLLPLFAVEALLVLALARAAGRPKPDRRSGGGLMRDLAALRNSSYLLWLLGLIAVVQVVITLIDYSFNVAIEAAYTTKDARTAIIGQVYAAIDVSALVLQFATAVVLRAIGVRRTLLAIPVLLGTIVAIFAVAPRLALMAVTKVASKAFDYSLFRAAKEILYIPLSYADKTRGKALVDILTYRVAKGAASLLVEALVRLGAVAAVIPVTLAMLVVWGGVTVVVTRRYAAQQSAVGK